MSYQATQRIEILMERLLYYASREYRPPTSASEQIALRWCDKNQPGPTLIVRATLKHLTLLMREGQEPFGSVTPFKTLREQLRQDLRLLQEWGVLQDNRIRTQGVATLHFTLLLWHHSPTLNSSKFRSWWFTNMSQAKNASQLAVRHCGPGNAGMRDE